jgi:hypothetical protein
VKWNNLALDMDKWQSGINTIINLEVKNNREILE